MFGFGEILGAAYLSVKKLGRLRFRQIGGATRGIKTNHQILLIGYLFGVGRTRLIQMRFALNDFAVLWTLILEPDRVLMT